MTAEERNERTGVFLRDATGLRKEISFIDSIGLNISWSSVMVSIGFIGFYLVALPTMDGVNLVYMTIISAVLLIPQLVTYTMMQRRMPRSGGDYVWVSRQLGGFFGNVVSFVGAGLVNLSYIGVTVLSLVFTIGSVGVVLGYSSFLGLSLPGNVSGSDPLLQFVVGASIFAVLVGLNILIPKYGFRLMTAFIIIGVIGVFVAWGVLLAEGHAGVVAYMNSLGVSNLTFNKVAASYTGSWFNFGNTVLLLPFAFLFLYGWLNMSTITGSELKKGAALKWSIPTSYVISLVLFLVSVAIMYYVGTFQFINAALSNSTLVYTYGFNFWTLAMGVSPYGFVAWFLGIAWILWNICIINALIISFSRYILAFSFDRTIPSSFGYVSPRYASPVVAHLVDLVVTVSLVGAAAFLYGTFSALSAADVAAMIFFACVGLSAAKYALQHEKSKTKVILMTAGLLNVPIFLFILYEIVAYSGVWGGNALSYSFAVGGWIAGALVYLVSRRYHLKHDNLDISLAFKEIPPE
jgi:amino acid transporter